MFTFFGGLMRQLLFASLVFLNFCSFAAGGANAAIQGPIAQTSMPLIQDFAMIPKGTFLMGSPLTEKGRKEQELQHLVTISHAFEIAKTVVTQLQWYSVMQENPSLKFKDKFYCKAEFREINGVGMCPNYPVQNISWNDSQ
jgi:formylglycine-generating enzyme required for sulfatase activity